MQLSLLLIKLNSIPYSGKEIYFVMSPFVSLYSLVFWHFDRFGSSKILKYLFSYKF